MRPEFDFDKSDGALQYGFHHWQEIPHWVAGSTLVVLLALYVLPSVVAFWRRHHNRLAIALLNALLGWTFIGWAVALVWAVTRPREGGVGNGGRAKEASGELPLDR